MMLLPYFIGWTVSTYFESRHDYRFEQKLRREDFNVEDLKKWKNDDALEKGTFIAVFVAVEAIQGHSILFLSTFALWNAWLRWLGHEAWMSYFSGRSFNQPGTTATIDLMMRKFGIVGWKYTAILTIPAILLTLLLSYVNF